VLDTIAGLPVHPLVVHAVVVLLPLSAIGAILMAVRPAISRRFGILAVLFAWAGAIGAFVARESGEQLAERVGTPQPHADQGSLLLFAAAGFAVLLLVFWLFDRGIPSNRTRPTWLVLVAVLVVVAALAVLGWTIVVGHSGAVATWSSVVQ
jgi:uncharacterized membrane protein